MNKIIKKTIINIILITCIPILSSAIKLENKIIGVWQLYSSKNKKTNKTYIFSKIISYHFQISNYLTITDTKRRQRLESNWKIKKDILSYKSYKNLYKKGKIKFIKPSKFTFQTKIKNINYIWTFTKLE